MFQILHSKSWIVFPHVIWAAWAFVKLRPLNKSYITLLARHLYCLGKGTCRMGRGKKPYTIYQRGPEASPIRGREWRIRLMTAISPRMLSVASDGESTQNGQNNWSPTFLLFLGLFTSTWETYYWIGHGDGKAMAAPSARATCSGDVNLLRVIV